MNFIKKMIVSLAVCAIGVTFINSIEVKADVDNAGLITVDLVIFAGQSNMSGAGGDVALAPSVPNGHGYEFRNGQDPAGLYVVKEAFGSRENSYISDPDGVRKGTLVSAFMNSYFASTGVPVLGISAARGGAGMNDFWMKPEVQSDLLSKYQAALDWCGANNVKVRKQYVVWLQGETDGINYLSAKDYIEDMKTLFSTLFARGLQQVFIISPGNLEGVPGAYDVIIEAQKALAIKDGRFTFATDTLKLLPNTYLVDGIHYNQDALNMVGAQTAAVAAAYSAVSP